MAQAGLSAELSKTIGAERNILGKIWYALRRWPIIPSLILGLMVFTAIFADMLAPHNPILNITTLRNKPPVWFEDRIEVRPTTDLLAPTLVFEDYRDATEQYLGTRDLASMQAAVAALEDNGYEVEAVNTNWNYILGADHLGRDVLSRIIHGARISLVVISISLASGLLIGVSMGLVAGYFGGLLDEFAMRITDIWLGLPFILVALVIVIALGQSFVIMVVLLALLSWTPFVRNVRGEVLSLKTRDYVSLAKVSGASTFRIMVWHILPGVINTVVVIATLRIGGLILAEATLSFLGAGIPPPTPSWGAMVSDGRSYLNDAWWISFFPGVAIFLVVMSLNFLGDWARDRWDPRLRQL